MKIFKRTAQTTIFFVLLLTVLFLPAQSLSAEKKEVNKTFKAVETVEIRTVSGDCIVKKGKSGEIKVHVEYNYPADRFEPVFDEDGNTLFLKEKFHDTWGKKSFNGYSRWTVIVPGNTGIDFSSASGDLQVRGLNSELSARVASGDVEVNHFKGKIKVKSASGDIDVKESGGEIKVKTASGDIDLEDVTGVFEVKTASGDIEANGIEFTGESNLDVVSGDVRVEVAKTPAFDLELTTVSGDVLLDYKGNPVKGYFVFKGKMKNFSSPFPFDNEEKERHYSPFGTKYFKKGGSSPKIFLKTVSGKLTLRK